ncbi:MAG: DUF2779 domain-containing protein [Bacilli bacterium]|nr:DUF2779 domain-containing protein [Bacilli bacterium]
MAITKTKFINYSRCPRYVALDEVKKERLNADISYSDYLEEEIDIKKFELISQMIDIDDEGNEEDLIDIVDEQLEIMLPYYKKIEQLAGKKVEDLFGGNSIYAEKTQDQKSFEFIDNGIKYLCYVDIYNDNGKINIIEVKATTSRKFIKDITGGYYKKEKYSLFFKDDKGIFHLKEDLQNYNLEDEMPKEEYYKKRLKLKDKYKFGKYIYDLAVQRMFIEKDTKNYDINYYLAVLNHEYVFDGTYIDGEPKYSNDIISLFDFTNLTKELQIDVINEKEVIEKYLQDMNAQPTKLGFFCEHKQPSKCKYCKICFDFIPKINSSLNYMGGSSFKDEYGETHKGLELINEGYIKLLDVPEAWIKNPNHMIQRECTEFHKEYIDKEKIKIALDSLKYPIYHLDFETFPCPLPKFKGEVCYTQSPFQFSLHIEKGPGICDKEKDHYEFLSDNPNIDCREDLTKALCEHIGDKGTVFAQSYSFEKTRLKELGIIYPKYKEQLNKMIDNAFDLLFIVKNNKEFYKELNADNFDKVNYYNELLSGSYSIKKTLPIFSDLKYENLDVKNGSQAMVTYANFINMNNEEKKFKYEALLEYCKQDTWAMVVILNKLREISK